MSEGGIGWVAMLLDRLDNIVDRSGYGLGWAVRPPRCSSGISGFALSMILQRWTRGPNLAWITSWLKSTTHMVTRPGLNPKMSSTKRGGICLCPSCGPFAVRTLPDFSVTRFLGGYSQKEDNKEFQPTLAN